MRGGGFSRLREWDDARWAEVRSMIRGANETDRAKGTV
jgi:hypothetical protein